MSSNDESREAALEKKKHPEQGQSLDQQMRASRTDIGAHALNAEARSGEIVDAVDVLPGNVKISESAGEGRDRKHDASLSGSGKKGQKIAAKDASADFDAVEPPAKVMIREVKVEIRKEMHEVQTTMKRLAKDPTTNAFELARSVELFRKMKNLLAEIAYRSAEYIRNLWLAINHGQKKITELV